VGTGPAYRGPGRDEDPSGAPADPGDPLWDGTGDWRPAQAGADWMDDPEIREAYLAALAEEDEPDDPDQYQDPDSAPPPGLDDAHTGRVRSRPARSRPARSRPVRSRPGSPGR
jgi:hypothetical protein